MTDPDMPVVQGVGGTGHGGHDSGKAADSGAADAAASRPTDAAGSLPTDAAGSRPTDAAGSRPTDAEVSDLATAAGAAAAAADATVTRLYADNASFVLTYVTGLLHDRHLAEDVVQETMLRAWRHCGRFSSEKGSVRGWLLRVAHNIAMDKIRMRRSRPTEVAESFAAEPQVGDHADAVVTAVHIRQALARLSPRHRDVLEQVYLNGHTASEAAVVLGIPEGTVCSRAYYGLRMLRRELGAAPAGPECDGRGAGPMGRLAA